MTRKIVANVALSEAECAALERRYIDDRHYDLVVGGEAVDVYKPDGSPLLFLRPQVLSREVCEAARPTFRRAGAKFSPHRKIHTGVLGYYDKPDCRMVELSAKDLAGYIECLPFVRECNDVFRRELPSRYIPQRIQAGLTNPDLVITATAFTTVTCNLWDETHYSRTRIHRDSGDLPEGFGVLSVLRSGRYEGGYLVFPAYRIAVDLRTQDMLLADVHELHGNGPIAGRGRWERIVAVMYYRTAKHLA
jgi:hypothetical protein